MQLKKRKNGGCAVYVKFKVLESNKANNQVDDNEKRQGESKSCSII